MGEASRDRETEKPSDKTEVLREKGIIFLMLD